MVAGDKPRSSRSEEHTSELQSPCNLVCRLLLEKKKRHNTGAAAALLSTIPRGHLAAALALTFFKAEPVPNVYLLPMPDSLPLFLRFFFNDTATTEIYTLSLHDALPILRRCGGAREPRQRGGGGRGRGGRYRRQRAGGSRAERGPAGTRQMVYGVRLPQRRSA